MKVIILAAGMGTRLGTLIPKPLTSIVNEKTILDYQIEKLKKYVSTHDIFVVVGYKKEIIMEKYPELIYIYNEAYTKTNTAKSLLFALNKINNTDVMWLNGDVYFDGNVIKDLIETNNNSILVDNKKCGDEEVKYNLDVAGYVNNISKTVERPEGEALGINIIKSKEIEIFREHLSKVEDQDYFEKALENMILKNSIKINPVNVGNNFCQEVDFEEDLKSVKEYIKNNK